MTPDINVIYDAMGKKYLAWNSVEWNHYDVFARRDRMVPKVRLRQLHESDGREAIKVDPFVKTKFSQK